MPTPTGESKPADRDRATVALVATSNRREGAERAMALLPLPALEGKNVLVKPNLNSADPAPGSTHPDVLRVLIEALDSAGVRSITIGDRSGMGETRQVMRQTGVLDLAAEYGARAVAFDELAVDEWRTVDAAGLHWLRGFPVPSLLAEVDAVVTTCNLKTHRYGGHFSLSLKNSVGLVAKELGGHDYMSELHDSALQRQMIAEVNIAYSPALVVLDGVRAFTAGGPDSGTAADTGVVLAARDRVAIDAVGVAILRMFGTTPDVSRGPVFQAEQLARAADLGLGVRSPDLIHIAVDDASSEAYAARVREALVA